MYTQEPVIRACAKCEGTGIVPNMEVVNCPVCHGTGKFLDSPCLGCGGIGTVELEDEAICPQCGDLAQVSG